MAGEGRRSSRRLAIHHRWASAALHPLLSVSLVFPKLVSHPFPGLRTHLILTPKTVLSEEEFTNLCVAHPLMRLCASHCSGHSRKEAGLPFTLVLPQCLCGEVAFVLPWHSHRVATSKLHGSRTEVQRAISLKCVHIYCMTACRATQPGRIPHTHQKLAGRM